MNKFFKNRKVISQLKTPNCATTTMKSRCCRPSCNFMSSSSLGFKASLMIMVLRLLTKIYCLQWRKSVHPSGLTNDKSWCWSRVRCYCSRTKYLLSLISSWVLKHWLKTFNTFPRWSCSVSCHSSKKLTIYRGGSTVSEDTTRRWSHSCFSSNSS